MVGNVKARYVKHTLLFKHPSGTSRGVLNEKETFFIILEDRDSDIQNGGQLRHGIGSIEGEIKGIKKSRKILQAGSFPQIFPCLLGNFN